MEKVKQLPLWGKIAYGAGAGGFTDRQGLNYLALLLLYYQSPRGRRRLNAAFSFWNDHVRRARN